MDAVELPYHVDVAVVAPVCKVMGPEAFGRAAVGTSVKETEHRDFDSPLALPSSSIVRFSSLHCDKDVSSTINASNSPVEDKSAAAGCSKHDGPLPTFKNEDLCQKPLTGHKNHFILSAGEECQLQFKTGRDSRSNGKCSKRVRVAREEESSSLRITDARDLGDISDRYSIKGPSLERNQSGKQRNATNKRGDRKNFKVPLKIKNEYFPLKGCSSISNLLTAGSTALGLYGMKADVHEVTKLVNDLSLSEILEGTYKCPTLCKEKGKKTENANESMMQTVRKVCSMLQTVKSSKSLNVSDLDISSDKKVCSPFLSSASLGGNGVVDDDSGDPSSVELASSNEDSLTKSEVIPVHPLNKSLYLPLDLYKRLALPPPKDLDSLLLDAAKPVSSSKSASDLRLGKQLVARRGGLPPFPWSHAFNGHGRTNSDAAKVHTVRATCPGKWARMKNPMPLFRGASDGFTDLDSIAYDQRMVPCGKIVVASECKICEPESPALVSSEVGWSSSAGCAIASRASLDLREQSDDRLQANQSSTVTAAARTLCEMATSSLKKASDSTKWPKKPPSQKTMKARKLNLGSNEHKELMTGPSRPNGLLVHSDKGWPPSKKPKLSTMESCFAKAPINWASPRSRRTSPSRFIRESISETKHSIPNNTEPRKSVLLDWSKGKAGMQ
ncbi:hypothetical protein SAY86_012490 [Trapa natans]|uniref:Uncharacterized protein n=1 Tax=Trapa natans TaxID=22666 RepID=A0AAN7MCY4_TRANT|nr:hypothetical protein SAY86_012490 [Trapa natans]